MLQHARFLGQVPSHVRLTPIRRLSDGSYLVYLQPSEYQRRKRGEQLLVRVIVYTINDPGRSGHGHFPVG